MTDAHGALLAAIVDELRAIRRVLVELRAEHNSRAPEFSLSRRERVRLARILPAVAGALGSDPFSSRDLIESEHAAVRVVMRRETAHAIGQLLRRACGVPIHELLVERLPNEFNAATWRIVSTGSAVPVTSRTVASTCGELLTTGARACMTSVR